MLLEHRLFDAYQFALIDRLDDNAPEDLPRIPLAPTQLHDEAHLLPYLVPLTEASPAGRRAVFDALDQAHASGEPMPVLCLLRSEHDLETVRRRMAARLLVYFGRQQMQWRYYDPHVFAQLPRILTATQLRFLFGPTTHWTIWLNDRWRTYEQPPANPNVIAETELRFNAAQTEQLHRIEAVVAVLQDRTFPTDADFDRQSAAADALIARAQAHGLSRKADQVAFAQHAQTVHPRFDEHPTIAGLLTLTE